MALSIYEQLAWLTNKVKKLCCAIDLLKQSGAGSYKVYTALLTQSGGSDNIRVSNEPLIVGVTYFIDNNEGGTADFTNVGSPNNNIGTYFVATGTTPNSWGATNSAEIFYNSGAPVVTVLENTIGNIWFTYDDTGYYSVKTDESEPLFTAGKSMGFTGSFGDDPAGVSYGFLRPSGADRFIILTKDFSNTDTDGQLLNTPIEIRVYN